VYFFEQPQLFERMGDRVSKKTGRQLLKKKENQR